MSKARSSDVTPVLALQGFNILTRTAAAAAPIALHIVQESDSEIHIKQSTTASIPAVNVRLLGLVQWGQTLRHPSSRDRWMARADASLLARA